MRRLGILAAAALLVLTGAARADEGAPAEPSAAELQRQLRELTRTVESLQKQLDERTAGLPAQPASLDDVQGLQTDLENFKYDTQRKRDTATALSLRALNVRGSVQAMLRSSDTRTDSASVLGRKSSAEIGAASVTFSGNLYKDYELGRDLGYNLRFGISPTQNTNDRFLGLQDAYLTYAVLPTVSPETNRLEVSLGQQLLPFGLEVQATEDLRPVINSAQFSGGSRVGTRQIGHNLGQRQIGLIVRGDLWPTMDYGYDYRQTLVSYAFGVVNGNGPNTADNNNRGDFVGRVAFTLPSGYNSLWRQLTVGASAYVGEQNLLTTSGATAAFGLGERRRYGLDVTYNHEPLGITYELIGGRDEVGEGTLAAPRRQLVQSRSDTLTLFYNLGPQFVRGYRNQGRYDDWWPKSYQLFVRLDRFDPDIHTARDHIDVGTLGLNIFFAQTTKFQLNYNRRIDHATDDPTSEILGQFQFGF